MAGCKDCARYRKYLRSIAERMRKMRAGDRRFLKFPEEIECYLTLMLDKKIKGDA